MAITPLPTLRYLILELENKIDNDYKKILADVLVEEKKTGWWGTWRTPVTEVNTFMKQIKEDLLQTHRLQNEGKLDRHHEQLLGDVLYRLRLLERAEQMLKRMTPAYTKEISELIKDMIGAVQRLIKAIKQT
jgi:hypothetical protein